MSEPIGTVYKEIVPTYRTDYIAGIHLTPNDYRFTFIESADEFGRKMMYPYFENEILKRIIRNLWWTYQYNQEYISYLLDKTSKEEFVELAKTFAQPFQEIDEPEQLAFAANIVSNTVGQSLDPVDLSVLLNVEPTAIIEIRPLLPDSKSEDTGSG